MQNFQVVLSSWENGKIERMMVRGVSMPMETSTGLKFETFAHIRKGFNYVKNLGGHKPRIIRELVRQGYAITEKQSGAILGKGESLREAYQDARRNLAVYSDEKILAEIEKVKAVR